MARIEITQDFTLPVQRVYAYLSEHENLGPLLGARITRVRDGDTSRNGAGSARLVKVGPLPGVEETVTRAVPDELVDYRITGGSSPLREHRGEVRFTATPSGSRLVWTIRFGAVLPLLDRVIALGLERSIRKGLAQVDAKA
ncbi:MAG: hypothetical protein JWM62_2323 [Frankiales bacterium]|jgi:uncharacterized protein YndB with AHSA1/START domain|nr:hypothetical protein [Frankiales bacterium]